MCIQQYPSTAESHLMLYLGKIIQVGVNFVLKFDVLWEEIVRGWSTPVLHHP
jgi:hypothetical protein